MEKSLSEFNAKRRKFRKEAEQLSLIINEPCIIELFDTVCNPVNDCDIKQESYLMGAFKIACNADLVHIEYGDFLGLLSDVYWFRNYDEQPF